MCQWLASRRVFTQGPGYAYHGHNVPRYSNSQISIRSAVMAVMDRILPAVCIMPFKGVIPKNNTEAAKSKSLQWQSWYRLEAAPPPPTGGTLSLHSPWDKDMFVPTTPEGKKDWDGTAQQFAYMSPQ